MEEVRKQRSIKKVAKKIQTEKVQAREHSRKEAVQDDFWVPERRHRVQRVSRGFSGQEKNGSKGTHASSKKSFKDKKYGFGGKKRGMKANTKASYNDDKADFKPSANKKPFRNMGKKSRQ